jgi:aminoacyl tRNA synthase complex-interacting multifunctional protein 1
MSSADAVSSLSSPLRELLVGSTQQDQQQLGVSEKDRADIAQWVEKAAQADLVKPDALQVCGDLLKSASFNLPATSSR